MGGQGDARATHPGSPELLALVDKFLCIGCAALAAATAEVAPDTPREPSSGLQLMRAVNSGRACRRGNFSLHGRRQEYWVHGSGYSFQVDELPVAFNLRPPCQEAEASNLVLGPWNLSRFVEQVMPESVFSDEGECAQGLEALAEHGFLARLSPDWQEYRRPDP